MKKTGWQCDAFQAVGANDGDDRGFASAAKAAGAFGGGSVTIFYGGERESRVPRYGEKVGGVRWFCAIRWAGRSGLEPASSSVYYRMFWLGVVLRVRRFFVVWSFDEDGCEVDVSSLMVVAASRVKTAGIRGTPLIYRQHRVGGHGPHNPNTTHPELILDAKY